MCLGCGYFSSGGRLDKCVYFASSLVFVKFFTFFIVTELKLEDCVFFKWVFMSEFFLAFYKGYWQALSRLFLLISIFINITLDRVFRVINSKATSEFKCVEKPLLSTTDKKLRAALSEISE